MATGDLNTYPQFKLGNMNNTTNIAGLDLTSGNVKVAVMKNTWVPATNFTTDDFLSDITLATYQVATGTGYTGPIALVSPTTVLNGNDAEFRANTITIPLDATGFTDGRWILVYYDTTVEATSAVLAYGDLGGDKSIQTSSLLLDWNGANNVLFRW